MASSMASIRPLTELVPHLTMASSMASIIPLTELVPHLTMASSMASIIPLTELVPHLTMASSMASIRSLTELVPHLTMASSMASIRPLTELVPHLTMASSMASICWTLPLPGGSWESVITDSLAASTHHTCYRNRQKLNQLWKIRSPSVEVFEITTNGKATTCLWSNDEPNDMFLCVCVIGHSNQ